VVIAPRTGLAPSSSEYENGTLMGARGARHLALKQNPIDACFLRKVDARLRGQQGFGVRVARRFVHALDRADFDNASQVHDRNAV
jgi:hypothetical protein